ARGKEVIYDAEHFFDGYRLDPVYAVATLSAAADAGAHCIVLCDTNGGELPDVVERRVRDVRAHLSTPLGIHPHNDGALAVANAHKGGIHVAAVAKLPESYQHIDPALVGNEMRVVVSELSGRQNVRLRAGDMGLGARDSDAEILRRVKELEFQGHQFEGADGSFEMLVRRSAPDYRPPFELLGFTVIVEGRNGGTTTAQAMVQLRVDGEVIHTAAEGAGPVNALDCAVRKALLPRYPELAEVHLVDYKVRIVDEHLGTAARPRVVVESARGAERWSTTGCAE